MNEVLPRTKLKHLSSYWEPFATSTPIKRVPNNVILERLLQSQPQPHEAHINIVENLPNGLTNPRILQNKSPGLSPLHSNKTRKNKSYFDKLKNSSSSEDDSSENKKRPIIRLSSRKKTKSLLSIKRSTREETETVSKINPDDKISDCKKSKRTADKHIISAVTEHRHRIRSRKAPHPPKRPHSSFMNDSFSSDKENHILDEPKWTKSLRSVTSSSKSTGNETEIPKVTEISGKSETENLKRVPGKNGITEISTKGSIFEEKGSHEAVFEGNSGSKTVKRSKRVTSSICAVKRTRCRNVPVKLPAKPLQSIGNTESVPLVGVKKHNLSHQLFSDSREQEFIKMLDLTREESNEAAEVLKCSAEEKENELALKPVKSSHPSTENICSDEIKQGKPKRTRQIPRKFWLPENMSSKPAPKAGATSQNNLAAENNDSAEEAGVLKKSKGGSTSSKSHKSNKGALQACVKKHSGKKVKRKAECTAQEEIVKSNNILNANEVGLNDTEQNSQPTPTTLTSKDEESNRNLCATTEDGRGQAISSAKPVFQRLNELSYKRSENGCAVTQCWNLRHFKCGIFRLKIKAQLACKTLSNNSYLGGVLVKGEIRMKIGDEEVHLKEGDMAFVPPLTKWQATNIGDCESAFYYWCGRFS